MLQEIYFTELNQENKEATKLVFAAAMVFYTWKHTHRKQFNTIIKRLFTI